MFSKRTKVIIITICILFTALCVFLILYIDHINIPENFSVKAFQGNKNITENIEVTGLSFFDREQSLDFREKEWRNESWYFNEIELRIKETTTDSLPINLYINSFQNQGTLIIEGLRPENDKILITELDTSFSFYDKLMYFIKFHFPLSWFNIVNSSIILILLYIVLIFVFKKKSNIQNQNVTLNFKINTLRYFLYFIVLSIGLYLRFSNSLTTLLSFDYFGQVSPAINYLIYNRFNHHEWGYPYPVFIIMVLSVFKNINAICVIQHILSVLSVIAFMVFLEFFFTDVIKKDVKIQAFFTVVSVLFFKILFFNCNLIIYEKNLHHEGLIIPSILLVIILIGIYFRKKKSRFKMLIFSITIFTLFILSLLQYRLTVGLYIVAVYILWVEIRIQLKVKTRRVLIPLLIFVVLWVLVFLPERILVKKYDKIAPSFAYTQFVYSNASTVLKAINEGYAIEPGYDTSEFKGYLQNALSHKSIYYPALKYDFDSLKYMHARPGLRNHIFKTYFPNQSENDLSYNYFRFDKNVLKNDSLCVKFSRIYNNYYIDWTKVIITKYPVDIIKKTLRQFYFSFFHPKINFASFEGKQPFTNPYEQNVKQFYNYSWRIGIADFAPLSQQDWVYVLLALKYNYKAGEVITYNMPITTYTLSNIWGYTIRGLFLFCFIYASILIFLRRISGLLFCILVIISATFFTIAFLHTFDNLRYLETLYPFILSLILFSFYEIIKKANN
ncbi:MAG: hypothetical protein PHT69_11710 [Bacteroidales bacterium]|nr:hypothetical protein [Bacteroidales bacterium]